MGAPARASAAAAPPIRTSLTRRRKWRGQARGEARRAAGGQRVVGARDVVAERGGALAPHEDAAGRRTRGGERLGGGADELEVLGGEGLGEREAGVERRARRPARAAAAPSGVEGQRVEDRRVVADGADDRALAVLGLGGEVERDQLGVGPVGGEHEHVGRARRSRRSRRRRVTCRLASWT